MNPLTQWSAGWSSEYLEDGTPIWQDETLGNAALDAAVTANCFELVRSRFPNAPADFVTAQANDIRYQFDDHYNAPENDWSAPNAFAQAKAAWLNSAVSMPGYVDPNASPAASSGMSPLLIAAVGVVAFLALSGERGRSRRKS